MAHYLFVAENRVPIRERCLGWFETEDQALVTWRLLKRQFPESGDSRPVFYVGQVHSWAENSLRLEVRDLDERVRRGEVGAESSVELDRVAAYRQHVLCLTTRKLQTCDEVKDAAEEEVRQLGYWPGRNKLTDLISCAPTTLTKAVRSSPYLMARKAEHESGRGREVTLPNETLDELIAEQHRDKRRGDRQLVAHKWSRR